MVRAVSGAQAQPSGAGKLFGALALGALALGLVTGCGDTSDGGGATRAIGSTGLDRVGSRAIERDVKAPEIFSMEEHGLWDGRPSLGGVWVAHPEVTDPERVMIRNTQTGETVVGALFRRERDNPGPRFQISSEAANALGILPGKPTTLHVVALQLQRSEPEPVPRQSRPATDVVAEDDAETERPAETALAALRDGDDGPETLSGAEQPRTKADEPEHPRGLRGLFSRRGTPASATSTGDAAGITMTSLPPSESAAPAGVPSDPEVAAPVLADPSPRERRGFGRLFSRSPHEQPAETGEQPGDALIPLPEDDPTPAEQTSPGTATLDRRFVQIGIFSIESNATGARDQMQQAGLAAEIRRGRMNDNQFWRVVVGPARDRAGQAAILEQVREMGFNDAYTVVR